MCLGGSAAEGDCGPNLDDETCCEVTFVAEADELRQLVHAVAAASNDGAALETACQRFDLIVVKYQEQPHLLDPHLEALVSPLGAALQAQARRTVDGEVPQMPALQAACKMLWRLCNTRGHKTVVRMLPNGAMELEPAVALLQYLVQQEAAGVWVWESLHSVLLWLSILALIPFSLVTCDTQLATAQQHAGVGEHDLPGVPPMVARLLRLCMGQLARPTSARDMAALLLGKLLTRPDSAAALDAFVRWALPTLRADSAAATFLLPGCLRTLAEVFKRGHREQLLPTASVLWPPVSGLVGSAAAPSGALTRKLAVKTAQRIVLTFLPARVISWRYRRQLAPMATGGGRAAAEGLGSSAANVDDADECSDWETGFEVGVQVEEAIEAMLTGLQEKDTVVRWSAAKGLARITARLPKALGDEVVGATLDSLSDLSSDSGWHGGCLALAELAQRGLLLPERLPAVVPRIAAALAYDVRRGAHSVGSHVRDAAAYVCWAFARAYPPESMAGAVAVLAPALVKTALYDREVNCRRAAAAAFQEAVGRLGNFPAGIDVVTAADYFSLATRSAAFLEVAPAVAVHQQYTVALAQHLCDVSLLHWERAHRQLAARALAALVPHAGEYLRGQVLPQLVDGTTHADLELRHGCVCGLAELVPALQRQGWPVDGPVAARIVRVPAALEAAQLFQGKGGELMRAAACRLVECCSVAGMAAVLEQLVPFQRCIDEGLASSSDGIQAAAADALHAFASAYLVAAGEEVAAATAARYADMLCDANPRLRRGAARALGSLPRRLLATRALRQRVVQQLASAAAQGESSSEQQDVDTRMAAVEALRAVCITCYGGGDGEVAVPVRADGGVPQAGGGTADEVAEVVGQVALAALLPAMEDYTTDNRGDVGSWVRSAAMKGLCSSMDLLARHAALPGGEGGGALPARCAGLLAKQAVERIARVREAAAQHLQWLATHAAYSAVLPALPLLRAAAVDCPPSALATLEGLPAMAALLQAPAYRQPLLEGLAASIGGFDAQLSSAARSALSGVVRGLPSAEVAEVAAEFVALWERHARTTRLSTPLLRTADHLLSGCTLIDTLLPEHAALLQRMVALASGEARGCRDVPRLNAVAMVLCQLLAVPGPTGREALQGVLRLLLARFPTVRHHTAEQLYVAVLALDVVEVDATEAEDNGIHALSEDEAAQAQELLLETAWGSGMDAAQAGVVQLAALFRVQPPQPKGKGGGAAPVLAAATAARGAVDTSLSYQSMLDNVARGY